MFRKYRLRQLHSIRLKCLDCCAFDYNEVAKCSATNCPLHPYRMGKLPKKDLKQIKLNVAKEMLLKREKWGLKEKTKKEDTNGEGK